MTDLRVAPADLTPGQRLLLLIVSIAVAITRVASIARGPWDWDEMLFLLALRDYDVGLHHPHPPGFPLFILAARIFVLSGIDPFRALQLVNLLLAIFIVPAVVFLCRELRFPFAVSLSAAVLFAFLPNVWFFGGTAFSDVAAIVLCVFACALLLRGARSGSALLGGAIVLAIAAGFRPQNLLVGFAPALIGMWYSVRGGRIRVAVIAAITGATILVASYGGAVAATGGWTRYRDSVLAHQDYLAATDSFRSAIRPSLLKIGDDFFIRPFRFPGMNIVLTALAVLSLAVAIARFRMPVILAVAAFGPFWIVAWLTLDFHSASRFSIGYMPLLAILCADGIHLVAGWTTRDTRRARAAAASFTIVIATTFMIWAWPALARVRRELSPPMQAIDFIARTYDDEGDTRVYVQKRLRPYTEFYLRGFDLEQLEEQPPPAGAAGIYLKEGRSSVPGARTLSWSHDRLWNIVRRRYFEVSVVPLSVR